MDKIKEDIDFGSKEYGKYYGHEFFCGNCHGWNHRYILKGVKIKEISFDCSRCGCRIYG